MNQKISTDTTLRIFTYEMHQDDPSKCTSAKMRKLGFARSIPRGALPDDSIVLNPLAGVVLSPSDRAFILSGGLVVIDCSWTKASDFFKKIRLKGLQRRLPALLAGNPTNYAKLGPMSSLEAVSAALYITGFYRQAEKMLSIYKWGSTFLSLNLDALMEYSKASSIEVVEQVQKEFFSPYLKDTQDSKTLG